MKTALFAAIALAAAASALAQGSYPTRPVTMVEPSPSSAAELARYMEREYDTWGKVVKQAGIKAQ